MIDDFLESLEVEARAAGLEPSRLIAEARDHLHQAISAYEAMGCSGREARGRAIAQFGEPSSIVRSMSTTSGGHMRSKIRGFAIAIGATAMATLWIGHVAPSQEIVHTPFEPVLVVAVAAMGLAAVLLLATINRVAAILAAPVAGFSVWAIASSAVGKIGLRVGGGDYIWVLFATAVLISAACFLLGLRASIGTGLLTAGLLGMILNGAWESTGGLGDGQGNIPVLLVTAGWGLIALAVGTSWWKRPHAGRIRRRVAASLVSAARRLEPDVGM